MTLATKCDRNSPIIQDDQSLLTVDSQRQSPSPNIPQSFFPFFLRPVSSSTFVGQVSDSNGMPSMTTTIFKQVSPENSHWQCGCAREENTFRCDHTCRLNQEWTLRYAKGPLVPGCIVAILSGVNTARISTYTFYWSHEKVIFGTFGSSDPTFTSPFTTRAGSMTLDWMYNELLRFPDTFTQSNLERAALMISVVKLQWVEEPQRIRDGTLSHPLPNSQTTNNIHFDGSQDMHIYCEALFPHDIYSSPNWQRENIITTLSGPSEGRPLLQMQDPTYEASHYRFELTADSLSADSCKIQHGKGKDFKPIPKPAKKPVRNRKPRGRGQRTRTGCFTCRKRHMKCDEARPMCGHCQRRPQQCIYPSHMETSYPEASSNTTPKSIVTFASGTTPPSIATPPETLYSEETLFALEGKLLEQALCQRPDSLKVNLNLIDGWNSWGRKEQIRKIV
jgi:hypothetical protein